MINDAFRNVGEANALLLGAGSFLLVAYFMPYSGVHPDSVIFDPDKQLSPLAGCGAYLNDSIFINAMKQRIFHQRLNHHPQDGAAAQLFGNIPFQPKPSRIPVLLNQRVFADQIDFLLQRTEVGLLPRCNRIL
ncbi:hypothetical protein D3C77_551920 [compost metagenome]